MTIEIGTSQGFQIDDEKYNSSWKGYDELFELRVGWSKAVIITSKRLSEYNSVSTGEIL